MSSLDTVVRRENRLRLILVISLLLGGLVALVAVHHLLVSFVLGFVMAYLIAPIVLFLERANVDRNWAIIFVFIILTASFFIAVKLLSPLLTDQINDLTVSFPKYVHDIQEHIAHFEQKLNRSVVSFHINISDRAGAYLTNQMNLLFENLPTIASNFLSVCALAPLVAFFILKDGRSFFRKILALVPNKFFEMALSLGHQINTQMGAFIRARLLESTIVGAVVWVGLAILDYPYATFLGWFAAITNLIPYIGPLIGATPAFVLTMINKDPNVTVMFVALIYITAQVIDMFLIIPLVVAKIVNLHPIVVIIAIIIGSQTLGILGMILSIPVASAIKLIASTIYNQLIVYRVS